MSAEELALTSSAEEPELFYTQQFQVRNYEVDTRGYLSPVVLLNFLQEAGGRHARQLGVAVADLHRSGLTWVLSRLHLQVHGLPRSYAWITLRTWPSSRSGLFSCREFEVFAENGELLAVATSSWAAIDLDHRRPVRLDKHLLPYRLDPRRAIADPFATLPQPKHREADVRFAVRRGDLDINQHVNNTVYAGWLLESVPEATYANHRLAALELGFRAEAFAGEEVTSCCEPASSSAGDCFVHQLRAVTDGRELVRGRSYWLPW